LSQFNLFYDQNLNKNVNNVMQTLKCISKLINYYTDIGMARVQVQETEKVWTASA